MDTIPNDEQTNSLLEDLHPQMSDNGLYRNAFLIFVDSIIINVSSYLFWIIIGLVIGLEVIGVILAVISLGVIIRTLSMLDLPTGLRRFTGYSLKSSNKKQFSSHYYTSFLTSLLFLLITVVLLVISGQGITVLFDFSPLLFIFLVSLVFLEGINLIPRSLVMSTMNVKLLVIIDLIMNTTKILMGFGLLFFGFDILGIILGILVSYIIGSVLLNVSAIMIFRRVGIKQFTFSTNNLRALLKTSTSSWIPEVFTLAGSRLGIIFVYSIVGAIETGVYYLISGLINVIHMIPLSIFSILMPAISGLSKGYEKIVSRGIRISLMLITPFTVCFSVFSESILVLINPSFFIYSDLLRALSIALIFSCFLRGIYITVLAKGEYHNVLFLGISQSVTQIVLYIILVPIFGNLGAAISYLLGVMIGFSVALILAHQKGFKFNWGHPILLIIGLSIFAMFLQVINFPWWISCILVFVLTPIIAGQTKVVTYMDLVEIIPQLIPRPVLNKIYPPLHPIIKKIFH